MLRLFIAVLVACVFIPADAHAYAFAAAKGSGGDVFEWCTRSSLSAARNCAENACEDQGGRNCRVVTTCSNGRWSGVAEVKFAGDIRRHGSGCGFTTLPKVKARMASECSAVRKSIKPKARSCLATIIDPGQNDVAGKYRWIWKNGVLTPN